MKQTSTSTSASQWHDRAAASSARVANDWMTTRLPSIGSPSYDALERMIWSVAKSVPAFRDPVMSFWAGSADVAPTDSMRRLLTGLAGKSVRDVMNRVADSEHRAAHQHHGHEPTHAVSARGRWFASRDPAQPELGPTRSSRATLTADPPVTWPKENFGTSGVGADYTEYQPPAKECSEYCFKPPSGTNPGHNYKPGERKNGKACDCEGLCLGPDWSGQFWEAEGLKPPSFDCGPNACGYFCHTYSKKAGECFGSTNQFHKNICDCRGKCMIHTLTKDCTNADCPPLTLGFDVEAKYVNYTKGNSPCGALYTICQGMAPWCALGAYLNHAEPALISKLINAFHLCVWQKMYFAKHGHQPSSFEVTGQSDGVFQFIIPVDPDEMFLPNDLSKDGNSIPFPWFGKDRHSHPLYWQLTFLLFFLAIPIAMPETASELPDQKCEEMAKMFYDGVFDVKIPWMPSGYATPTDP